MNPVPEKKKRYDDGNFVYVGGLVDVLNNVSEGDIRSVSFSYLNAIVV